MRSRSPVGQPAEQQQGHQQRQAGGGQIDRAPAAQLGDGPGQRPRLQDAEHHAAGHGSHHLAALRLGRQRCRVHDQELDDHREEPHAGHGHEQQRARPGRSCRRERERAEDELEEDQTPALDDVAERDEQDQAGGVADLRHRDHGAGRALADAEAGRDLVEQGLGVEGAGDRLPGGERQQQDERARQRCRRVRRVIAGRSLARGRGRGSRAPGRRSRRRWSRARSGRRRADGSRRPEGRGRRRARRRARRSRRASPRRPARAARCVRKYSWKAGYSSMFDG